MSKEKVRLSGGDITQKWMRNMGNAVNDIVDGINAVSESPAQKAIAAQDKMLQNVTQAITSGRWANQLGKVQLGDWKTKTAQKVRERLVGGVQAAQSKHQQFANWLVNRLNGVLPEINAMPDLTLNDSVARATRIITYMAEQKYKET